MVRSTNPVALWKLSVHRIIRFMFSPAQNSLISLLLKQLPLSVRKVRVVPLSEKCLFLKFVTVRVSVFLQICAIDHLLKRSTATKIYTSPCFLDLIGPAKISLHFGNWPTWFCLISVLIFLPAVLLCWHVCAIPTTSR